MTVLSCMGGWCAVRESCALHMKANRRHPVERLCESGDHVNWQPIVVGKTELPMRQVFVAPKTETTTIDP